ncbi:DUF5990 family protein [Uliginosibacterium sp. H1]|uniref:DUF5990 family protein n=1 Tax=Uliginosibacterium sp. H1 TaxID=3114757 RepID=UPI002E19FCCC|nr:DUF5990 family protein [Uliginosibacterium sp. H1]
MRILVASPPPGVRFAVQRGKSELLEPSAERADAIQFEFSLRLGSPLPDGSVNFMGEFAQGTPSDRFIYVNSGTLAGQADSPWTRRAKLKLSSIPQKIVADAASTHGVIEARMPGTMGDGGPICASVKSEAVVWSFVRSAA